MENLSTNAEITISSPNQDAWLVSFNANLPDNGRLNFTVRVVKPDGPCPSLEAIQQSAFSVLRSHLAQLCP